MDGLFVLPANGNDNDNANSNNITYTIKDSKLYVPVFTLSVKGNQKLSKLLRKGFERLVYEYENACKTKSERKDTTKEYRYFLGSNFLGVNRLLVLIHSNVVDNEEKYKDRRYYFSKGIIHNQCKEFLQRTS